VRYNLDIRKNPRYKTLPYLLYLLSLKRERPGVIAYEENEKIGCMISIFFLGAIFGASIPYIPTSISGTTTAFFFLYFVTNQNSIRGDLFRLISIRLYTLFVKIMFSLCKELNMTTHVKSIVENIMHLCFILDRKHRIYDRVVKICGYVYYNMILKIWNSVSGKEGGDKGDRGGDEGERKRFPEREYDGRRDERRRPGYDDKRDFDDRRRPNFDDRRRPDFDDRREDRRRSDFDDRRRPDYDDDRRKDYDRYDKRQRPNDDEYRNERRYDDDKYYKRSSREEEEKRPIDKNEDGMDDKKAKSSFWNVLSKK